MDCTRLRLLVHFTPVTSSVIPGGLRPFTLPPTLFATAQRNGMKSSCQNALRLIYVTLRSGGLALWGGTSVRYVVTQSRDEHRPLRRSGAPGIAIS